MIRRMLDLNEHVLALVVGVITLGVLWLLIQTRILFVLLKVAFFVGVTYFVGAVVLIVGNFLYEEWDARRTRRTR